MGSLAHLKRAMKEPHMEKPRNDESQDAQRHEEDSRHHPFEKGSEEDE